MRRFARLFAWVLALVGPVTRLASAQELRGTVRDGESREPVAGAIISLLNATGGTLGRNITDERGRYHIIAPPTTVQLRFVRIGFRPVTLAFPRSNTPVGTLDAEMTRIPSMLEPVPVRASACPRRSDEGSALGLLEQARASLLNSVVAREANPAALVLTRFERSMDGTGDRITRQRVMLDSMAGSTSSYYAARSAADFVQAGFVSDVSASRTYYGPDAEALLDDEFLAGYCFRIVKPDRDHPTEVGLGFAAPKRVRDRVDIEGILWVDTTSRRLRQLEFRYVGLDRSLEPAKPGGWLSFRDMANGVVIIDRWSLRLPAVREELAYDGSKGEDVPRQWLEAREVGGELARAEWPGLPAWNASLGTLRIKALTHNGKPAAGARVWLDESDYTARADSQGEIVVRHLIPGPYKLSVIDSQLLPLRLSLPTEIKFTAVRDSIHRVTLDVPTADYFVESRCRHDGKWRLPRDKPEIAWMIGRVVGPDGKPIAGVWAEVAKGSRAAVATEGLKVGPAIRYRTGTDGIFHFCPDNFYIGDTVRVRVDHRGPTQTEFLHKLTDSLTVFPLVRAAKRP